MKEAHGGHRTELGYNVTLVKMKPFFFEKPLYIARLVGVKQDIKFLIHHRNRTRKAMMGKEN